MRTASLFLVAVLALAAPVAAQCTGTEGVDFTRVTLDEVNAIPQANIDALNAAGAALTVEQITDNIQSAFVGERIEFSAIIMTNPVLSGLGSPSGTGAPNRYHVFVRDTAADTEGPAGMGGQLVDGDGISEGAITNFFVGDEVTVCGEVSFFSTAIQINPESISDNNNPRGAGDEILDPVVVTTADIHDTYNVNGDELSQVDWDIYGDFINQYVRFETIELVQGIAGGRPNMLFSTTGEDASIRSDDISVCFRNDRASSTYYPGGDTPACVADGDFVPPATGIVNVQGFLALRSTFDAFGSTVPAGGAFAISAFEDTDFEIAVAPPIINVSEVALATPAGLPVQATVLPGTAGNTVASVTLAYTTTSGVSNSIPMSNTSGDLYEATITGLTAGDFVTYSITAVDNEANATTPTAETTRLVVDGAIADIFQVQATADGGVGGSGITTADPIAFNLDAVVQTAFFASPSSSATGYYVSIQDDASLSAFSGVQMFFGATDPGLAPGDRVTITQARVVEEFGVTQLEDVTFTTGTPGDPYGPKTVATSIFGGTDGGAALEQHEGLLLRFEDGIIASANADGPNSNFGEFTISTDGGTTSVRVDDSPEAIPAGYNDSLTPGQTFTSVEGLLTYTFGNFKLFPPTLESLQIDGTSVEGGLETANVRIVGTYPNPAAASVRVRFELAAAGDVSLQVFDAMGRQVATLTEGAFGAARHTVEADLGGLATGVYVVRLVAGSEIATTRLVVVR